MAPGGPYLEIMETLETPETPDEGVVQCTPSSIQPELHEAVNLAVSYAVLHDIETDRLWGWERRRGEHLHAPCA